MNPSYIPKHTAEVCVIMPVFNRWHETKRSIDSLLKSDYLNLHIIVIDSGSSDETSEEIKCYDVEHLRVSDQLWWAGAINAGIRHAMDKGADYILVYDCGVTVRPDTISKLVNVASGLPRSILAAALFDGSTKKLRWAGKTLHWLFPLYRHNVQNRNIQVIKISNSSLVPTDTVFGRVALINVTYIDEVGLFRDNIFPHYHADIDWALRAKEIGFQQYVMLEANAVEFHISQVPVRLLQKDTYFNRKSHVNFEDTWKFFKYCCPYRNAFALLFIAFYIEFFLRCLRGLFAGIAKRVLSRNVVSRIEKYKKNQAFIDGVNLAPKETNHEYCEKD